ncbi:siroheme synthase CysG [Puniceibacterium sediminis]|uniref:Uroporphyrin-III C-methyltransferase / precorrin-2 dehydrogenase / sirohydrochlorin ferrochelatase n=1 Tax=Puniceibacterium sediminis TaxID=1608407 RepID=A0A238WSW9_9RHOB|nr:siroheme synthase CysG [Puniceibacterium sediminis]SNR49666.1 uroporphyrin-III C-methyltransferase / precorrin-2 dehydrogenase / sirohydrochlorin ferrochelatase [Puniceibacterium sediminis]
MKSFPMFIRTTGRRVIIAGGGEQAAQKARLLLKTDAKLILLADTLDPELQTLVAEGRAIHQHGPIAPGDFKGAAMAFIATGCPAVDASLHALAQESGVLVNVVDQPALCDITTPSIVDRDPVVVAIGTEGTAPVLARAIKTRIEEQLDPRLGSFAALAGRLRDRVAARVPRDARRAFWRWAFHETPWQNHKRGAERDAAQLLKQAIEVGGAPQTPRQGQIALVGAGPGARDLLTLRAVERLQEADVIFYDRLVDPGVLELARRDAERVFVGKVVGATAWPQDRINALIVAEALKGRRVVRLKSGDPAVFGRATEELDAARAAGIPIELVPGVTAVSGAAAAMGRSLTLRGQTDTLVLTTGQCRDGDAAPDWQHHARPGTALAFYMSVGHAEQITAALLANGMPADLPVTIAVKVTQDGERFVETTISALATTLASEQIKGSAVIMVSWPKDIARVAQQPLRMMA